MAVCTCAHGGRQCAERTHRQQLLHRCIAHVHTFRSTRGANTDTTTIRTPQTANTCGLHFLQTQPQHRSEYCANSSSPAYKTRPSCPILLLPRARVATIFLRRDTRLLALAESLGRESFAMFMWAPATRQILPWLGHLDVACAHAASTSLASHTHLRHHPGTLCASVRGALQTEWMCSNHF